MLFGNLLTSRAQVFADVRTYWSPEAVKKATGYELEGPAKAAGGFIHLINSGAACLDANGRATDENGNGVMKPWYEVTRRTRRPSSRPLPGMRRTPVISAGAGTPPGSSPRRKCPAP